jgi:hypothetical protein
LWGYAKRNLEPVDPLSLRDATAEGGLACEEAFAARPHPDHGRDQRRVQEVVGGRRFDEPCDQILLEGFEFGLKGADAPIELTLGEQVWEVGAQMSVGEAPEVTLAPPARLLCEYCQG